MPTYLDELNKKAGCNLEWLSDHIRLEHLKNPAVKVAKDDLEPPPKKEIDPESDYVYVRDTPRYKVFAERWVPSCKSAFRQKYKTCDAKTIKLEMSRRMGKIGKCDGLSLKSFSYENGIMTVVFRK